MSYIPPTCIISLFAHEKKNLEFLLSSFLQAPTRFELVIEVLQTFALPLGHGAIFYYILIEFALANSHARRVCEAKNTMRVSALLAERRCAKHNDSYGNRTRVTAVKGRCLNRLTKEPKLPLLDLNQRQLG